MKTVRQPAIALAILLAAMASLGAETPCPPALVVLPGAQKVSCGPFEGSIQVGYHLTVAYPAEDTILDLRRKLQEGGWLLLAEDFLMPGTSAAPVEGWSIFLDGTQGPTVEVHQWMADWVNLDGQVLRFGFRYFGPEGAKSLNDLQVFGILIPAAMARANLAETLKRTPSKPR